MRVIECSTGEGKELQDEELPGEPLVIKTKSYLKNMLHTLPTHVLPFTIHSITILYDNDRRKV